MRRKVCGNRKVSTRGRQSGRVQFPQRPQVNSSLSDMEILIKRIAAWPRVATMLCMVFLFVVLYQITNRIALWGPWLVPLMPLENTIPFIAWTVPIYLTSYIVSPFGILIARQADVIGGIRATLFIFVVHSIIFFLLPTTLPRVAVPVDAGWLYNYGIAAVDRAQNCFPSQHVAFAVLTVYIFWRRSRRLGVVAALWALALCISTLTTKQHYILDVLGGIITGSIACYLAFRGPLLYNTMSGVASKK